MSIWSSIKSQLRSVIEWEGADEHCLFQLWSDNGDEIKDASSLIVNPGQGVIFVYEGQVKGVFTRPGRYVLETDNEPFFTTLERYMQGFESEHKVGIYFFWLTDIVNQKWGTRTPIKYQDPVYNFPVGLRAHGNFSFKLTEAESFFEQLVGARADYRVETLRQTLNDRLMQPLTDLFAESGLSYAQIDGQREELASRLTAKVSAEFEKMGLVMTDFRIEGTQFDQQTNERIGRIADIAAESNAAKQAGLDYRELQQLEALRDAARNEGGAAGAGVSMGAGMGLGQMMGQQAAAPAQPDVQSRLLKLKQLLDQGLINEEDYESRKNQILQEL